MAVFIAASWLVAVTPTRLPRPSFEAAGFVAVTLTAGFVLASFRATVVFFDEAFFVLDAASAAAGAIARAVQMTSAVVARKPRRFVRRVTTPSSFRWPGQLRL